MAKKNVWRQRDLKDQIENNKKHMEMVIKNGWVADFETTTEANLKKDGHVRVFAWALVSLDDDDEEYTGDNIESFHELIKSNPSKFNHIFFHNLAFDFTFYEIYLQKINYIYTLLPEKKMPRRSYTTLRSTMGALYTAIISPKFREFIHFYDTAKLFPVALEALGDAVGIKKLKEDFDYDAYRPLGYKLTDAEKKYLMHDVYILKATLLKMFDTYETFEITRSSLAYTKMEQLWAIEKWGDVESVPYAYLTKYWDKEFFPPETVGLWKDMRRAYFGGIVYVNPKFKNKKLTQGGNVYDANSEYPGAMLHKNFPTGHPIHYEGQYCKNTEIDYIDLETDFIGKVFLADYPLFIQGFKAKFKLKDKGIPCLAKKLSYLNKAIMSNDDLINEEILLTNVDLKHFFLNYDVEKIVYTHGYAFKSVAHPFKSFIEHCAEKKIEAEKKGDMLGRLMYKLDMNGSYGKFAQNIQQDRKCSEVVDDVLKFTISQSKPKSKNNMAMACFITSWARDNLLSAAYTVGVDRLCYMDTDSIHFIGDEIPEEFKPMIDSYELGKWKHESRWSEAKFLRDKCYVEIHPEKVKDENGNVYIDENYLDIKCAGLSHEAKQTIKSIDDFQLNKAYEGTIVKKNVKGGILLTKQTKWLAGEELTERAKRMLKNVGAE